MSIKQPEIITQLPKTVQKCKIKAYKKLKAIDCE